jgi:hypothetical protein
MGGDGGCWARLMDSGRWMTRDGQVIPIRAMKRSHILNALDMIRRRRGWRREYLDRLQLELMIRDHLGEQH